MSCTFFLPKELDLDLNFDDCSKNIWRIQPIDEHSLAKSQCSIKIVIPQNSYFSGNFDRYEFSIGKGSIEITPLETQIRISSSVDKKTYSSTDNNIIAIIQNCVPNINCGCNMSFGFRKARLDISDIVMQLSEHDFTSLTIKDFSSLELLDKFDIKVNFVEDICVVFCYEHRFSEVEHLMKSNIFSDKNIDLFADSQFIARTNGRWGALATSKPANISSKKCSVYEKACDGRCIFDIGGNLGDVLREILFGMQTLKQFHCNFNHAALFKKFNINLKSIAEENYLFVSSAKTMFFVETEIDDKMPIARCKWHRTLKSISSKCAHDHNDIRILIMNSNPNQLRIGITNCGGIKSSFFIELSN